MKQSRSIAMPVLIVCILAAAALPALSQTTGFTYQGSLSENGAPAEGSYDLEFILYDAESGGSQVGSTLTRSNVPVEGGVFSVQLDFGAVFPGAARFLEIRVRPASAPAARRENLGGYATLSPRQEIKSVPYAVRSISSGTADSATTAGTADTATNALNLGGVAAGQYVLTTDPRLTDARTPTAGSPDYIQNTTTEQPSSDFNISGTGEAGIFDAATQFNIGGNRVLSIPGIQNLFVGPGTGPDNTTGQFNSFFGSGAGESNTTGSDNSFFGLGAGESNTTGNLNSFFGRLAGRFNTTGSDNSFFGHDVGSSNNTGTDLTLIGAGTNVSTDGLNFATAIGAGSVVSASNTVQLGRAGTDVVRVGKLGAVSPIFLCTNPSREIAACESAPLTDAGAFILNQTGQQATSNFHISGEGTANIFDADTQFNIGGNRYLSGGRGGSTYVGLFTGLSNTLGDANSFFGERAGQNNTTGSDNSFFGYFAGRNNTEGNSNSFFGRETGKSNTTGSQNSFFGAFAGINNTEGNFNSFFGQGAGQNNITGFANSFFGQSAGPGNTVGNNNSFFGVSVGTSNTTGNNNSFFGNFAGQNNNTGSDNSFFGRGAGITNVSGSNNTAIGYNSDVASGDLSYATAIGSDTIVSRSNTIQLGRSSGADRVAMYGNLGIGTDTPGNKFELSVNSAQLTMGGGGCPSGSIMIGFNGNLSNCTNYSIRGRNGTDLMLNRPTGGQVIFRENNGSAQIIIHPGGEFEVRQLGSAGSEQLCRNASDRIATCSSSLRYKTGVTDFTPGLDVVRKLRPVFYKWKDGGMPDVGLVAEEVSEIEPLLTTEREGRVEGVKYDRLGVVLVNAVQEQQDEIESLRNEVESQRRTIETQREEIERLKEKQKEFEALKELVCAGNETAPVCRK